MYVALRILYYLRNLRAACLTVILLYETEKINYTIFNKYYSLQNKIVDKADKHLILINSLLNCL